MALGSGPEPVGNAQQVESRLDLAVLAVGPVQAEEHAVGELAQLQHVFADAAGAFPLACGFHRLEIGGFLFNGDIADEAVGRVEGRLERALVILESHIEIHKDSLMAESAQGLAYGGAGHEGDMALGADAAAQNHDFHKLLLSGNNS